MGRKKRSKPNPEEAPTEGATPAMIAPDPPTFAPPPPMPPPVMPLPPVPINNGVPAPPPVDPRVKQESTIQIKSASIRKIPDVELDEADLGTKPSSMYGLHSHSGDLIEDDIYVSDGSLESDDEDSADETGDTETDGTEKQEVTPIPKTKQSEPKLELVLTTSKMGLMRRGGISSLLGQPINRTWVRSEQTTTMEGQTTNEEGTTTTIKQEEEEVITDPVLLLQIQQRKIEEAKQNARILESSENAGRDPCLFSKRTAFDIRMDQIEEKPWEKGGPGGADITDYMNYGLTEEDWIEYAERQLAVRQELTDAAKQKRLPDPGIVPVVPRAPTKQGERVAVRVKKTNETTEDNDAVADAGLDSDEEDAVEMTVETGPQIEEKNGTSEMEGENAAVEETSGVKSEPTNEDSKVSSIDKVVGGAWGAGAKEDSVLLKLIREQSGQAQPMMMGAPPMMMGMQPPNMMGHPNMMMGAPPPPPPPKMMQQYNQNQGHTGMKQENHNGDRRSEDGPWRRDMHNQQGNNRDRERFNDSRDDRGHPDSHWNQQPHSSPNFRQRGPPPHGGGPPPGDYRGGPPGGRFGQWGPGRGRGGPPMGRGRGDQWGGPGRGGPPQWGDGRKRPRDYDHRGGHGRW